MAQRTVQQAVAESIQQEYVTSDSGVTFSGGVMLVHGAPQRPELVEKWESSNGLTQYTTVGWKSDSTGERRVSCNCPGWTMKKKGQSRRCKHTDSMIGVATCDARRLTDEPIRVQTIAEAEALIPKFNGRPLREIDLG